MAAKRLSQNQRFDENENEKLIKLVQENSVLYDVSLNSYRDKHFRNNAWATIAESMQHSAESCRQNWESLRAKYRRTNKKQTEGRRSGSAASTRPEWHFMKHLHFLDPFLHGQRIQRATDAHAP